jgi:hypothetical protein
LKWRAPATGALGLMLMIALGRIAGENVIYLLASFTGTRVLVRTLTTLTAMVSAMPAAVAAQRAITKGTRLVPGIAIGTLIGIVSHAVFDAGLFIGAAWLRAGHWVGIPLVVITALCSVVIGLSRGQYRRGWRAIYSGWPAG